MTQPTSGVEHSGEEHDSEGHSVAAWTAVGIILVGALVMSLAVVFPSALWFVVGARPAARPRAPPAGAPLAVFARGRWAGGGCRAARGFTALAVPHGTGLSV